MSQKNTQTENQKTASGMSPQTAAREKAPEVRYPNGCPIDEHQGYGCNCNPVPIGHHR